MINHFIRCYNEDFKDKSYEEEKCKGVLEKWKTYREKILNDNLPLDEYTNRGSNYLTYYLEHESSVFGRSKGGSANQYMVKMNEDRQTYYLEKNVNTVKNENADFVTANTYYETFVFPLLKLAVQCSSLEDVKNLENNELFKRYYAKQMIYKIIVLESKVKESDFKYLFVQMYDIEWINYFYNKFGLSGDYSQMSKNYRVMVKALELLDIPKESVNERISFEVYNALLKIWQIHDQFEMRSITDNVISKKIMDSLKERKQIVLTGAPGTGKTFSARQCANEYVEKNGGAVEFVQFHPSFDYSDFVEGLRPILIDGGTNNPTFVKLDGIFKSFCRKIVQNNYEELKINHSNENQEFNELYSKYEDEVSSRYYFIIDEINRADLSKVFGELMFGLEESYRGIGNKFQTQYQNLKSFELLDNGKAKEMTFDCFEGGFFIPLNVYIIGTMNDIDKSVEAFDFALRRRFEWINIKAQDVCKDALPLIVKGNQSDVNQLIDRIFEMNEVISTEGKELGLSESYHIGHAYFKDVNLDESDSLNNVFKHKIKPMLKEYTRGREKDSVDTFIRHCANKLGVTYES